MNERTPIQRARDLLREDAEGLYTDSGFMLDAKSILEDLVNANSGDAAIAMLERLIRQAPNPYMPWDEIRGIINEYRETTPPEQSAQKEPTICPDAGELMRDLDDIRCRFPDGEARDTLTAVMSALQGSTKPDTDAGELVTIPRHNAESLLEDATIQEDQEALKNALYLKWTITTGERQ